MANKAGSWVVLAGLGLVAAINPLGCVGTGPVDDNPLDDQAVAEVLATIGPEVVLPTLHAFRTQASLLESAIEAWDVAASEGLDTDSSRADAQAAFVAAMAVWQEAELHQIGPAAASTARDGEALRDEIYSWPTINPCRIDQETVEEGWNDSDFFTISRVNSYGLDALEHVLFSDNDNVCAGQMDINADGSWDALGAVGVERNRISFASALIAEIGSRTDQLIVDWEDGYSETLATSDAQEGLNAVYDALFYLETSTKDGKLRDPIDGVEDVEGIEAGDSLARIEANLVGFRALFTGGEGQGIDDLLDEVGHGDLATKILSDTDIAIEMAQQLNGRLDALIESDAEHVQVFHDQVKLITDAIKGDLVTVLTLQIPSEAAGDAD